MLFFSRTKTIATLAVLALCFLLALPNALPASVRAMLPLFNGPVVLGLDLQGGSHVLLEVDQATLKDQSARRFGPRRFPIRRSGSRGTTSRSASPIPPASMRR